MLYHYSAVDKDGKIYDGEVDAEDLQGVLRNLGTKQLRPLSVKPLKESTGGVRRLWGRITIGDKIFLTKYLSLMLRVGTDLLSAINILIIDFDKPAMKSFLLEVRDNIVKGQPFYVAFSRYPGIFSPVFVSLVKSAEMSGNLQQTFENLSTSLAEEADLRSRIRSALVYPIILLTVSVVIVLFISTFALPKIANVFLSGGVEPPPFSRIVFTIGLFLADKIYAVIVTLILAVVGGIYLFWFNRTGRRLADKVFGYLPVVRRVRRDIAIQRFAATLSSLMKSGLPIVEAVNITAETVGSETFRAALYRISQEGLSKGLTIGEAFRRETVFPKVVTNLVAISEKGGHLEEVLETLATFYNSNINAAIKALVSLLEPVLLTFMGVLVATIALSIIVPIYQLTTKI